MNRAGCEGTVVHVVEVQHVPLAERHARVKPASFLDHGGRQIDPGGIRAAVVEVARDVTGAASKLADWTGAAHLVGEAIEKLAVQWLAGKLVGQMTRVLRGEPVVRALDEGAPNAVQGARGYQLPVAPALTAALRADPGA